MRGRSRAAEHTAALSEIGTIARERAVDLVLVAGDIFDGAAPTAESEEIAWRALLGLAQSGARVIVIAGNHDHPRRLAAVRPLLDLGHVTVQSTLARPDGGGVIAVEAGGMTARVVLLPFLSQRGIVTAQMLMEKDASDHVQTYADRYRKLTGALCDGFTDECINLVVAHATVVGARMGGGEREAHTIFDYAIPSQVFPASAHYVALGHIHRAQRIEAACPVWYSGAPLQLDFGEEGNEGGVLIIDAEPGLPARIERVALTSGRLLRTVRGSLDALEQYRDDLGDAFLRVVLEESPRAGLADEARALFPHAVDVSIAPIASQGEIPAFSAEALRASPADLFAAYLAAKKVKDSALIELFAELMEAGLAADTA